MLTLTVRLLHGTFRASSSDLAMTGQDDPGEWPPSPARLVAALVAAGGGVGDYGDGASGDELRIFENTPPPRINASRRGDVAASRQRPRFVVINKRDDRASVQEYPARNAAEVRPGMRLAPRETLVTYRWDALAVTPAQLNALQRRAARIGYLGCADSPATVTIDDHSLADDLEAPSWDPQADGDIMIAVPAPGFLDGLTRYYEAWTTGAARRSWYPIPRATYRSPDLTRRSSQAAWAETVWLRLEGSLPGQLALRVTETLKAAVLDLYQRYAGEPPAVLHGHGYQGPGFQHAQYLALLDFGHEHATAAIHGLAIMLPSGTGADVMEGLRTALWRPWQFGIPGRTAIQVRLHGGEPRPFAAHPRRWSKPAREWISVLPIVHERRRRGGPTIDDVGAWCRHAGLPEPIAAHLSPVPMAPGSPALRPEQIFRDREGVRRPYSYVRIRFAERLPGPIVLGRARQFGIGLMAPVEEAATGAL